MTKVDLYREKLINIKHWDDFLLQESGLPGPRANLELVQAVLEEGNEELFKKYILYDNEKAPTNSPYEFLALCGVVGLGTILSEKRRDILNILRIHASDIRWRIREGVAMALQIFGENNMELLLIEMREWSKGNLLEKRAAAAALCEPSLLKKEEHIEVVIEILNDITASIDDINDRRSEEFTVLKKGLAYCWSVGVAALPAKGKAAMEKWFLSKDKDILWIMKENLKKNRLIKMDKEWVEKCACSIA